MEEFGRPPGEIGPALGLAFGISGAAATFGSGVLADRLLARGIVGSHYVVATVALGIAVPFGLVTFLSSSPWRFLCGAGVCYFAGVVCFNMGATSLQLLTPAALRGRISSLYMLCTNIVGAGSGPLLVAMLTEHVFHDPSRVGVAVAIVVSTAALLGASILGVARQRYSRAIMIPEGGSRMLVDAGSRVFEG